MGNEGSCVALGLKVWKTQLFGFANSLFLLLSMHSSIGGLQADS
jgi:hypothetical protein